MAGFTQSQRIWGSVRHDQALQLATCKCIHCGEVTVYDAGVKNPLTRLPSKHLSVCPLYAPQSFFTTFGTTEDPISESGRFLSGARDSTFWSDIAVTSGLGAYGTQSGAISPPYDDSCAYALENSGYEWSPDQVIEAQVYITTRSGWTGFHEHLLLGRGRMSTNFNRCYEALFPATGTHPLELVEWKGPPAENSGVFDGNPDTFAKFAEQSDWPGLSDGDWIKFTLIGTMLRMYHRTDAGSYGNPYIEYDASSLTVIAGGAAELIYSGLPGFGHWKNGNGNLNDHGFISFRAEDYIAA